MPPPMYAAGCGPAPAHCEKSVKEFLRTAANKQTSKQIENITSLAGGKYLSDVSLLILEFRQSVFWKSVVRRKINIV